MPQVPSGFKVPANKMSQLPAAERPQARQNLWDGSGGLCHLCAEALPEDGKRIDVDHVIPVSGGGKTTLSNLFLAHRVCNGYRSDMTLSHALKLVPFWKWAKAKKSVGFDDVIGKFLPDGKVSVAVTMSDGKIKLVAGGTEISAPVFVDPATHTEYFFSELPANWIQNDEETQPRKIEADHVKELAIDFSKHPVHEPSNCRLVMNGKVGRLLQFDGQHKTTAQILLGRSMIPTKIYIEPNIAMIQELVVAIQQGIKKRPLSTSDTLNKLDDVIKDKVEAYRASHDGVFPTEVDLVNAEPASSRREMKKLIIENMEWLIINDPRNALSKYKTSKISKAHPFTDTVLLRKIVRPFVCQDLINESLESPDSREVERNQVIDVLNHLDALFLEDKWSLGSQINSDDVYVTKARRFFMQGSFTWVITDLIRPQLIFIVGAANTAKPFVNPFTPENMETLLRCFDVVAAWPIWNVDDQNIASAMRSNTISRIRDSLPSYTAQKIQQELQS